MQLVNNDGRSVNCSEILPSALSTLSQERIEILRMLSEKPRYPAELARELDMPVQTIYYHIRLLEKAKLLEFVDYEEHNGGVAKKYSCAADGLAIVLNAKAWRKFPAFKQPAPNIFAPFIKNGFFNGLFVVGSPDPHGKYRARASELGVLELAMLLGQYATFSFPLYSLDTQVTTESRKGNLILAGGPKVNTIILDINSTLPVKFGTGNFELYSTLSKKKYLENAGVIERVQNPASRRSSILLVGGLNYAGTRAAMLALVRHMDEIEQGNSIKPNVLAKVVQGFDEDGDGMIDAVEILE